MNNLPPGVSEYMIPGNRPEDIEWDRMIEQIEHDAIDKGYESWEMLLIYRLGCAAIKTIRENDADIFPTDDFEPPIIGNEVA